MVILRVVHYLLDGQQDLLVHVLANLVYLTLSLIHQLTLIMTRAMVKLPGSRSRSLPLVVRYTMLLSGIITIIITAVTAHLYNLP